MVVNSSPKSNLGSIRSHGSHPVPFGEHSPVRRLRHTLEAPVSSPEEQIRRPVVGQIFGVAAGRAAGEFGNVGRGHRCVERVAAHHLVEMGGGREPWIYKGVDSVYDDLLAAKSAHSSASGAKEAR